MKGRPTLADIEAEIKAEEKEMNRFEKLADGQKAIYTNLRRDRIIGGVVIFVIILFLSGILWYVSGKFVESESEILERSIASCTNQNIQTERTRAHEKSDLRYVLGNLLQDVSPDQQNSLDVFYAARDKKVDKDFPLRICTKEGIKEYLSTTTTGG